MLTRRSRERVEKMNNRFSKVPCSGVEKSRRKEKLINTLSAMKEAIYRGFDRKPKKKHKKK